MIKTFASLLFLSTINLSALELIKDGDSIMAFKSVELTPYRVLLDYDMGLKMLSPYTLIMLKGNNWAKVGYQVDGYNAFVSKVNLNECQKVLIEYKTGNNLTVLKSFALDELNLLKSDSKYLVSYMSSIKKEGLNFTVENQEIIDNERKVSKRYFKFTSQSCSFVETEK